MGVRAATRWSGMEQGREDHGKGHHARRCETHQNAEQGWTGVQSPECAAERLSALCFLFYEVTQLRAHAVCAEGRQGAQKNAENTEVGVQRGEERKRQEKRGEGEPCGLPSSVDVAHPARAPAHATVEKRENILASLRF